MFTGFVAVIILLIVIAGIIAVKALSTGGATYAAEVKKVQELISRMKGEAKFYYLANNESYSGFSIDYYKKYHFAEKNIGSGDNMVACSDTVTTNCWEGMPVNADNVSSPYNGSYINLGGTAGDQIRIIAASLGGGTSAGIYIVKKKPSTVPEEYTFMLERALANDPSYFGG